MKRKKTAKHEIINTWCSRTQQSYRAIFRDQEQRSRVAKLFFFFFFALFKHMRKTRSNNVNWPRSYDCVPLAGMQRSESANTLASSQHGEEDNVSIRGHPILRQKEASEGMGMIQYKGGDEAKIIQSLVLGQCFHANSLSFSRFDLI